MKLHIFGASGSGVTTLGLALAERLGVPYFDSDEYFWLKTEPPFTSRRDGAERNELLLNDLAREKDWIFGGSMIKWGITLPYSLVVFLYVPPVVRMERLKKREWERYGTEIFDSAKRNEQYRAFLEWAASYESPDAPGRSKKAHEEWFAQLTCAKMTIAGDTTVQERVERVMEAVGH